MGEKKFAIVPPDSDGKKRAVVIGINYFGTYSELKGCVDDAKKVNYFLKDNFGFEDKNITLLLDDGSTTKPTKFNILYALKKMASDSKDGDVCFVYYSGHGTWVKDKSGDEKDGFDEALCACDDEYIIDDELFEHFVLPTNEGVHTTCIFDSCMSGTVLDLPYRFKFFEDGDATDNRLEELYAEWEEEYAKKEETEEDRDDQMLAMMGMLMMMQLKKRMGSEDKKEKLVKKMEKMMEFL